ncbi:hypothetical protein EGW08_018114 [Elysia chlorotica]|uniref:Uncharacterized protein n=1 Tax=Elysia chlorotica TaxID=188477 RepID=A0A3S0ZBW0_ELYCH|nr:hypothetical protein EGW08_018114 [Elysia chlorotica]
MSKTKHNDNDNIIQEAKNSTTLKASEKTKGSRHFSESLTGTSSEASHFSKSLTKLMKNKKHKDTSSDYAQPQFVQNASKTHSSPPTKRCLATFQSSPSPYRSLATGDTKSPADQPDPEASTWSSLLDDLKTLSRLDRARRARTDAMDGIIRGVEELVEMLYLPPHRRSKRGSGDTPKSFDGATPRSRDGAIPKSSDLAIPKSSGGVRQTSIEGINPNSSDEIVSTMCRPFAVAYGLRSDDHDVGLSLKINGTFDDLMVTASGCPHSPFNTGLDGEKTMEDRTASTHTGPQRRENDGGCTSTDKGRSQAVTALNTSWLKYPDGSHRSQGLRHGFSDPICHLRNSSLFSSVE